LTDGRANIARDGTPGRPQAEADALAAGRRARAARVRTLLVDTSPRPQPVAARLAAEMGALYLPLPHADAATLSRAVQTAAATT
jgi:magnesium chelatase subunit D